MRLLKARILRLIERFKQRKARARLGLKRTFTRIQINGKIVPVARYEGAV